MIVQSSSVLELTSSESGDRNGHILLLVHLLLSVVWILRGVVRVVSNFTGLVAQRLWQLLRQFCLWTVRVYDMTYAARPVCHVCGLEMTPIQILATCVECRVVHFGCGAGCRRCPGFPFRCFPHFAAHRCPPRVGLTSRTMATQSPVTHTSVRGCTHPRFQVLSEESHRAKVG